MPRRPPLRSRARARLVAAALCTPAFCVLACANVLGVANDPTDAVVALCGCPVVSKAVADCEQTLDTRIALATSDVRAAWLSNYTTADCTLCENAPHCFYLAPTCVTSGNPCTSDLECCSWVSVPPVGCDLLHGVCK